MLAGLYPTDEVEAVYADMAADAVTDCHMRLAPTMRVEDPVKKVRSSPVVKWIRES